MIVENIRKPTRIIAGAVAKDGTAMNTGARNIEARNSSAVVSEVRPVLPPAEMPEVEILGAHAAPHVICLAVPGVRSQGLIGALEQREIYVSAGSACSRGHRSHVLEAMEIPGALIDGAIRVSLGFETTEADVDGFLSGLGEAIAALR